MINIDFLSSQSDIQLPVKMLLITQKSNIKIKLEIVGAENFVLSLKGCYQTEKFSMAITNFALIELEYLCKTII